MADYFIKMRGLADEMAMARKKLEDEEIVSYILTGLRDDYDAVVTSVTARVEPIFVVELYTQLTSYEQHKEMNNGGSPRSSVNMVVKGGQGGGAPNYTRDSHGGRRGFARGPKGGHGGGGGRGSNFQAGVIC
jgi:hypothetical protein